MPKRKIAKRAIKQETKPKDTLTLRKISPLTPNQEKTFHLYDQNSNLVLHGYPGVGKTFLALYLALDEILYGNSSFEKIFIIRSVVPSRDIGFLPGSIKEKTEVYEEPYIDIVDDLFGKKGAYALLKTQGKIEFTTTSFLRGKTFNNCIVIVDELQNCSLQENDTVITRIGENSKVIFCGDFRQTDLTLERDKKGLMTFLNILKRMNMFEYVEFEADDIIRSSLVKEYIITKYEMGIG